MKDGTAVKAVLLLLGGGVLAFAAIVGGAVWLDKQWKRASGR